MSAEDRRTERPRDVGVLRSPGSGVGRPEAVRESIATTQTAGGLAAGDPAGGPQRTPERRAIDEARGEDPRVRSGRDPDLGAHVPEPVRAPEDVNATPPHGDKVQDERSGTD